MRTAAIAALVAATLAACGAEQGSDGMTIKIPHLIAYAGTPQEQDLGPFVDFDHYWSKELGAYVKFSVSSIGYEEGDCKGLSSAVHWPKGGTDYSNGGNGFVIKFGTQKQSWAPKSYMTGDSCGIRGNDPNDEQPGADYSTTGEKNLVVNESDLTMDLR